MGAERDTPWAVAGAAAGDRIGPLGIFRVSLRLLLVGALGIVLIGLSSGDHKAMLGAAVVALVTPALQAALRRGHPRFAMTSAVGVIWLLACVEIVLGDGIRDTGMGLFTVVVLVSALLLDRVTAVAFSALSVLSVLAIGIAGVYGWLSSPLARVVAPGDLAILTFLLAMCAVLVHAVARALYAGIDQAALNEQAYREIFNATSDAIFICDAATGRTLDVNAAACALSGYSRAELLARDGIALLAEPMQHARAHQLSAFEWQAARKGGGVLWVELALQPARIRGRACVLISLRDISERKAAAAQARSSERLKALGQLAGGVAHDFNNQLTGIVSSATLLKSKLRHDTPTQTSLDLILQCSQRSADLTRQLLAFARKGERREQVVDVDALVREVVQLLERSIDKRVAIRLDLACDDRVRVLGDASLLGSALLNLGLNARDAMPQGGILELATRRLSHAELPERARSQLPAAEAGFVLLRVQDNGIGIAPEALEHVFEPFFTTKPQGSGLGLSAAYGTVQAHGGVIHVTSAPGSGTSLELVLPATERPLSAVAPASTSKPPGPVRVLLAEDEADVGRSTELVLQDLGCAVTWRRDGQAALAAFEHDPDGFDVIILDHSMPRLLGSEVGDRIAALRPRLPIIATSGFAEELSLRREAPWRVFLPKPFGVEQLSAALERALAEPHARESPS